MTDCVAAVAARIAAVMHADDVATIGATEARVTAVAVDGPAAEAKVRAGEQELLP